MTEDEKRFAQYRNILKKRPAMLAAYDACRSKAGCPPEGEKHPAADPGDKASGAAFPAGDAAFLAVFAPVLTEFVSWVLCQAQQDGFRRLYFLAREATQSMLI